MPNHTFINYVYKNGNYLLNINRFLTIKLVTSTNMTSNRKEDDIPSTYNCLQCSSKFKQRFNLIKHIKSVHTPDEFQCDQCAYTYFHFLVSIVSQSQFFC